MNEDHYLVEVEGVKRFMSFKEAVTHIACGRKYKFGRYFIERGDEMRVRTFDKSPRDKIRRTAALKRGDLLGRMK